MLDLNQAGEQKEAVGAIPPKSIVPVRLNIRAPKAGFEGSHPLLTRSEKGLEYLNCEFEVAAGQFQGRKIWENLGIFGITDGQKKNVEISTRKLRAIVEASRGINPKDQSPQAVQGRRLQSFEALQGIIFGVKVGVEKPEAGDRYVNNTISLIITPDHEFYAQVMGGQELITAESVPSIPQASAAPAPGWAASGAPSAKPAAPVQGSFGGWGAQQQPQPVQTVQGQSAQGVTPGWAQTAQAQAHTPHPAAQYQAGPAFPSNASGMDDVPF